MQPHQLLASHRPLALACVLSALIHGLLIWPAPSLPPEAPLRGGLKLALSSRPTPQPEQAPPAALSAPEPTQAAALARHLEAARPLRPPAAGGRAQEQAPTVSEAGLRSLRYALARHVPAVEATLAEPVMLVLRIHLRARRVVAIDVARGSGRSDIDAQVLAAFKAASREAVIPEAVPDHAFTTEFELEVGGRD